MKKEIADNIAKARLDAMKVFCKHELASSEIIQLCMDVIIKICSVPPAMSGGELSSIFLEAIKQYEILTGVRCTDIGPNDRPPAPWATSFMGVCIEITLHLFNGGVTQKLAAEATIFAGVSFLTTLNISKETAMLMLREACDSAYESKRDMEKE